MAKLCARCQTLPTGMDGSEGKYLSLRSLQRPGTRERELVIGTLIALRELPANLTSLRARVSLFPQEGIFMKNVLRRPGLLVPMLLVSALLAFAGAPSAGADVIYSYNDPFFGDSWSFEVPTIITTTTTITSFLNTNIVAGGVVAGAGCTAIDFVQIIDPNTSSANVTTHCSPVDSSFSLGFSGPITSFNTFTDSFVGVATLTISPSPSGVPEPSSLLLLAGGLTVWGLRRKWMENRATPLPPC
jgi:hypothetical protein